jgi:hypothetical protein
VAGGQLAELLFVGGQLALERRGMFDGCHSQRF